MFSQKIQKNWILQEGIVVARFEDFHGTRIILFGFDDSGFEGLGQGI
jgi:hypothetical protein